MPVDMRQQDQTTHRNSKPDIIFNIQQDFSLLHNLLYTVKTGQVKLMHIKAVASGKDLTSPDESRGAV